MSDLCIRARFAAGRAGAAALLVAAAAGISAPASATPHGPRAPHVMPFVDRSAAPANAAAPRLQYFAGPVISHAQVVQVLYGGTPASYASYVWGTSTPNLADFYGGAPNSAYFDWLSEYDTPRDGGTSQSIGRGGFVSRVVITPSAANGGASLTDAQIRSEIAAQLQSGALPAPTSDPAGNPNTVYMVNFPQGTSIQLGTAGSCVTGGFCAYHGAFSLGATDIYYGVLPDMGPTSACSTGCGPSAIPFNNQTAVASHELVESVTDAVPGLGWFDPQNGEEIGDLCDALQATVVGGDGRAYVVQREWSNRASACIATAPFAPSAPALGRFAPALALALLLGGLASLRVRAG